MGVATCASDHFITVYVSYHLIDVKNLIWGKQHILAIFKHKYDTQMQCAKPTGKILAVNPWRLFAHKTLFRLRMLKT